MNTFDEYIGRITDEYTTNGHLKEVQAAKREFFGFIGAVHEEDSFFENYMTAFIEWYIFTRDLTDQDIPPVRLFYRKHFKEFPPDEKKIYSGFTKSRHTMFTVKKITSSFIQIHELYSGDKLKIENEFPTAGFNAGDIFEAILVPFKDKYVFTKSFFFHPVETKSFILKEMKKIQQLDVKILHKVLMRFKRLRLKFDRYPHVSPEQIYNEEEFRRNA